MSRRLLALLVCVAAAPSASGQGIEKTEDVIYGRKHGLAMTLDVVAPKANKNGAGVIVIVSGGWISAKELVPITVSLSRPLLTRGYTLFAVVHGSQPKFTVPEAVDDLHRAVRFVRANAKRFDIDPDRLGISGASAGGHLSLMMGTAFRPADPDAVDPVNRVSSRPTAVACFYPPTDFFQWDKEDVAATPGPRTLGTFRAPFDFTKLDDKWRAYVPVTDPGERTDLFRAVSPVYHVTKDTSPSLLIHGDADKLVPLFQSERMLAALRKAEVPCELVVKKGGGHGWVDMTAEMEKCADWFDKYMPKK